MSEYSIEEIHGSLRNYASELLADGLYTRSHRVDAAANIIELLVVELERVSAGNELLAALQSGEYTQQLSDHLDQQSD